MALRSLSGRLERLEQHRAATAPAGRSMTAEERQALEARLAEAAAICGDDIMGVLRRFGDAPQATHETLLRALTDRELLLLALVLYGTPIEEAPWTTTWRSAFDGDTAERLNAALVDVPQEVGANVGAQ